MSCYQSNYFHLSLIIISLIGSLSLVSCKTLYYVSSSGTSQDGTSIEAPMNFETMLSKNYESGDSIYFKRGDTFYGSIDLKITKVDDSKVTIDAYDEGSNQKPIISAYKIVSGTMPWEKSGATNVYKIDLTNTNNFHGIKATDSYTNQIGFIEDKQGNKYTNLLENESSLVNAYDFACDGTYLYIKTQGKTPYAELGELKLATKTFLMNIHSNTIVKNLHFKGTGAHGIEGSDSNEENIEIVDNIIEDIGGSFLSQGARFGNAIEFYCSNAKNVHVHKNIIRNVYDVGFTIQGNTGSGRDILVEKNVFVTNSQDSEIWEGSGAGGVYGYLFTDNISIGASRGWGYEIRPNPQWSGAILFWGYNLPSSTKIQFYKNIFYDPARIYFIASQENTREFFKQNYIDSDKNKYYLTSDAFIYNSDYKYERRGEFKNLFNKDRESTFEIIDKADDNIMNKAKSGLNYQELRSLFINESDEEEEGKSEPSSQGKEGVNAFLIIFIIILILAILFGIYYFIRKRSSSSLNISNDFNNPKGKLFG